MQDATATPWTPIRSPNQRLENPETEVRPLIERFGRTSQNRFGYHVLDPEGNRIGVYFSEGGLVTIQMASETEIAWIKPAATSSENQRGR